MDEHELFSLHSFQDAGQPIGGPTKEREEQLNAAQANEASEQGEATQPMDVEDEEERFAPYLFDVRPRQLQHSRMVTLSKRLTVCLRHDKGEFGLEWTSQAMTPLEKVLSLRIMQEKGAKLEEVLAVVYHSDKKRFRLGVMRGVSRSQHGGGGGPSVHKG